MVPHVQANEAHQRMGTAELRRQDPDVSRAIEREAARREQEARLVRERTGRRIDQHEHWPTLSRLPMRLTAGIPLPRFKVKDLLALERGQVLTSTWSSTDDVPLKLGAVQLSWSEFEVVEQHLAVRLTRLA